MPRVLPLRSLTQPHFDVHLVPCHPPRGELDGAPRTSLAEDSASERWDGFWCEERYYARCTRADGGEQWFTIVDSRRTVLSFRRASYGSMRRESFLVSYVERRTLTDDARRTVLVGRRARGARP